MKKYLFLTLSAMFVSLAMFAQTNLPRVGAGGVGQDNTYRTLTLRYDSLAADAAGLDTISVKPRARHTTYYVNTVLDSFALKVSSVATSYKGDVAEFIITNSSTGVCVRFAGANIANQKVVNGGLTNTVMYLTASKPAYIRFVFNGTKWIETERISAEY